MVKDKSEAIEEEEVKTAKRKLGGKCHRQGPVLPRRLFLPKKSLEILKGKGEMVWSDSFFPFFQCVGELWMPAHKAFFLFFKPVYSVNGDKNHLHFSSQNGISRMPPSPLFPYKLRGLKKPARRDLNGRMGGNLILIMGPGEGGLPKQEIPFILVLCLFPGKSNANWFFRTTHAHPNAPRH